ncbi:MAG: hypothetical protein QM743_11575 [Chitinophagaceae bacterium]
MIPHHREGVADVVENRMALMYDSTRFTMNGFRIMQQLSAK